MNEIIIQNRILYQDDNYILVDKPYDVRMDGNYDYTLEKALMAEFSCSQKSLKWVHQLDSATSGILCVARNREAASIASSSFESRETSKEYLAILEGHLQPLNWKMCSTTDIALLRAKILKQYENTQETNSKNRNEDGSHVNSEEPKVPYEQTWQDIQRHEVLTYCLTKLGDIIKSPLSNISDEVSNLYNYSYEEFSKDAKLRKKLRKKLKQAGVHMPMISYNEFETSKSNIDNQRNILSRKKCTVIQSDVFNNISQYDDFIRSHILCSSADDEKEMKVNDQNYILPNNFTIVVMVPIIEPIDSFLMDVATPNTIHQSKFCETRIHIQEYAIYEVITNVINNVTFFNHYINNEIRIDQ
jgi:hypothetical protein